MAPGSKQVVLGLSGCGFGDVFKLAQFALYLHQQADREVRLYPFWHGYRGPEFRLQPLSDHTRLAREIMEVLDGESVEVVRRVDLKGVVFPWDLGLWRFPYTVTRRRWEPPAGGRHGRVTAQLDGVWKAAGKNPPSHEVPLLLGCLPESDLVLLGKNLSVRQCVDALACSDLFFGVDSGMLQLAYAVGTPAFLITYQQDHGALFCWHGDKHAVWCRDTDEFIVRARCFLGLQDGVE